MREFDCPQCGEKTPTLNEGYCEDCREENQRNLNEHNRSFDNWQRMNSDEREAAIRGA